MPVGEDVRVLWYDNEEQCAKLLTKIPKADEITPPSRMQSINEMFNVQMSLRYSLLGIGSR